MSEETKKPVPGEETELSSADLEQVAGGATGTPSTIFIKQVPGTPSAPPVADKWLKDI